MLDFPVAILAGGLGTRLRPALADVPKPLAPVGGRPFVSHLLDQLADAGFRRVTLLIGYRGDQLREALGTCYRSLSLAYSQEPAPLGTAGALRFALPRVEGETLLLMNGDSFCEVDFAQLVAQHRRRRADLTMALTKVPDADRFGSVQFRSDGRIDRFAEKQTSGAGGWINAGIYMIEKGLVEAIPPDQALSLERDLLPAWLTSHRVFAHPRPGRFLDIGTPESYAVAEAFFAGLKNRKSREPDARARDGLARASGSCIL
jgi:D-glycero-alpha-D-manno-heptose 1-phosphate guanylyltransferase